MSTRAEAMDDSRFDDRIHAALTHEAGRAALAQPSRDEAARRVAMRIAMAPRVRIGVMGLPGSRRAMSMLWVALLLATLAAVAVVGARLLQDQTRVVVDADPSATPAVNPSAQPLLLGDQPFGAPSDCLLNVRPEVLVEFTLGNAVTTLYASGDLVVYTDPATYNITPATTRKAKVAFTFHEEYQLTPEGIELILDRIDQTGLTPGCRTVRTVDSSGSLIVSTSAGVSAISWGQSVGDNSLARLAPIPEVLVADALAQDLYRIFEWLPAETWQRVNPVDGPEDLHWLVLTTLVPTDYGPKDVVHVKGSEISAGDGRYDAIRLPDHAELLTFGQDIGLPSPFWTDESPPRRCGLITGDQARRFAESLDEVAIGVDGFGDVYSPDMSTEIYVELVPVMPADYDCEALRADLAAHETPQLVEFAPGRVDELAHVDPCGLVPATLSERLDVDAAAQGRLEWGALRACTLQRSPWGALQRRLRIALVPWRMTRPEAESLALGALGAGGEEQAIEGGTMWLNHCIVRRSTCAGGVFAWKEPYLVVMELVDVRQPSIATPEGVRPIVEDVLQQLRVTFPG